VDLHTIDNKRSFNSILEKTDKNANSIIKELVVSHHKKNSDINYTE
jgi:hypothetical protein